jgi:queuine tRNA-ribosyltransferase
MLLTEHNLTFYQQLMLGMRGAIADGLFGDWVRTFRESYLRSAD